MHAGLPTILSKTVRLRMVCSKKNVYVEWWLQCSETDKLQIYRLCV